jgi:hypothetical protein
VKSASAGRPIYDDVEYITIMVPGDATSIIHRPVWERDRERFAAKYLAFQQKKDQDAVSGTPLLASGIVTAAQARELEFFHCRTVEHLANMSDSNAVKFIGIQDLKRKAQLFLENAKSVAPMTTMKAELDKRDDQIAAMQAQINALLESQKPKRGRKAAEPEPETIEEEPDAEEVED